jgi:hypothetical protein
MRKATPADFSPRWSVRGYSGYRRSNHAQTPELRARLAAQLAIPAGVLMLTAMLAACGSVAAPGSAASGQSPRPGGTVPSSAAASPPSRADVLAAARRVKCPSWKSAISPPSSMPAQRIPAGFRPVAVVECIRVPAIVPVAGTHLQEVRRVAFTGLGRLVAALRLPSTPRSRGLVPACLMPVANLPWIVLIGPGDHLVRPRVPTGACGAPIVPVEVSLSSLHWKTLSATKGVWGGPQVPANGSPFPNIAPAVTAPQPAARR